MATRSRTPKNSSVAAIKRHRTGQLASLATRAYYFHRRGQDERMYELIGQEFVSLGGVYVKFLQGVLLQSQMMQRWHNPDRLNVFENLDHEPLDIVAVLRRELSPEQLAQITLVQPQPFAAGSFGQVYSAQLANGKQVVIKILRPMVRELLRYDLKLLGVFSRSLVGKLSPNMDVDLDTAIKEFRAATLRETDYVGEANFAHELFEAYKGHATFIIPETFLELCTPNVIVQEYVAGLSVAQLLRVMEQGVDPAAYVREYLGSDLDAQLTTLGIESLSGVFDLPRVQGDPHPGNVRLLTGDRVGLIDFGISARSPRNKAAFFGLLEEWSQLYGSDHSIVGLFEQFMRFFVNDLYRALQKLSSMAGKHGGEKPDNYTQEVGRVAQEMFTKSVGVDDVRPLLEDGRIFQVINQVVNKDNRFGLVMHLESSEILRASQTYMSLVETLGRRGKVLPRVFSEVVERVGKTHPELRHQGDEAMSIAQALETASNWMERVANRDPALFHQLMNRIKLGGIGKPKAPKVADESDAPEAVNVKETEEAHA